MRLIATSFACLLCACDAAPTPAQATQTKSKVVAWKPAPVGATAPSAMHTPVPVGPLLEEEITLQFAVYLPHAHTQPVRKALQKRIAAAAPSLAQVDVDSKTRPPAFFMLDTPPIADYSPPDLESLEFRGVGLSTAQKKSCAEAKGVVVLILSGPAKGFGANHRAAQVAVQEVAAAHEGVFWDEGTGQIFSDDALAERVAWKDGMPDVGEHITIHVYRDGDFYRMISLGLGKFGVPDIVVEQVPPGGQLGMSHAINLLGQLMIEGATIERTGTFVASIDAIKHAAHKVRQEENILEGATGSAELTLAYVTRQEGDADNRLIEIIFPDGDHRQIGQFETLEKLYGSEDAIEYTDHDDKELSAASVTARGKALELKPRFAEAPPFNEHLSVKAPFVTDEGGTEWMWVEVAKWQGTQIHGTLSNSPFGVSKLKLGAAVIVEEDTIFDYIHELPDGSSVGNTTGDIITRQQAEKKAKP